MLRLPVFAVFSLAALISCSDKSSPSKKAPDESTAIEKSIDAAPVQTTDPKSAEHIAYAKAVKDSLLATDVAGVQQSLAWLAEPQAAEPASWKPFRTEINVIAAQAQAETEIPALALAAAQIARQCGACHSNHDKQIEIDVLVKQPEGNDFKSHMAGHRAALNRMWAGLAGPSDVLWRSGATLLAGQPTHLRKLSLYGDDADKAIDLATRTHALADKALDTTSAEEREVLFAQFLGGCASCHVLKGSAPEEP